MPIFQVKNAEGNAIEVEFVIRSPHGTLNPPQRGFVETYKSEGRFVTLTLDEVAELDTIRDKSTWDGWARHF